MLFEVERVFSIAGGAESFETPLRLAWLPEAGPRELGALDDSAQSVATQPQAPLPIGDRRPAYIDFFPKHTPESGPGVHPQHRFRAGVRPRLTPGAFRSTRIGRARRPRMRALSYFCPR